MSMNLKRIYDPISDDDGVRVLVDRIWPRGLTKARAKVDLWQREIAPSNELRQWFDHDPDKWAEFKRRYSKELRENKAVVQALREKVAQGRVTLLFAAKDVQHNNAVALKEYLARSTKRSR